MRPRSSFLLTLAAAALALAGPARADTVTLKPTVHMLGEWIDGMVFDGKSLWINEFGQHTLAEVNPATYGLVRRVTLTGIADKIVLGHDGAFYLVLELEDSTSRLWQLSPAKPPGKSIATLDQKACLSDFAAGTSAVVWMLGGCNGDNNAALYKIDIASGASAKVALDDGSGGALLVRQGQVWAAQSDLSVIDETSMAVRKSGLAATLGKDSFFSSLAADASRVYAGVGVGDTTKLVIAIDPQTLKETARVAVDQTITVIVADAQNVVAFGSEGRIFVLAPGTLELKRTINLSVPHVEPRAAMIRNGDLLLTDFRLDDSGEKGALLVLKDWRPAAAK